MGTAAAGVAYVWFRHLIHRGLLLFIRLLSVTVVIAFCAEYRKCPTLWRCLVFSFSIVPVVASIEETAVRYSIPKAFIGVVLLPIVVCFKLYPVNCHPTSSNIICRAMKNKYELTITICVGSSIASVDR
jgi:Ca2+:H+ antiporter